MLKMSSKSCASTYSCIIWWWHFCSRLHNGMLQSSRSSARPLFRSAWEIYGLESCKTVSKELNWKYLKRLFIFWLVRIDNTFRKTLIAFIVIHSLKKEFTQIWQLCHFLLNFMLFQGHILSFVPWNILYRKFEQYSCSFILHTRKILSDHVYQAPQWSKKHN